MDITQGMQKFGQMIKEGNFTQNDAAKQKDSSKGAEGAAKEGAKDAAKEGAKGALSNIGGQAFGQLFKMAADEVGGANEQSDAAAKGFQEIAAQGTQALLNELQGSKAGAATDAKQPSAREATADANADANLVS